MSADPAAHVSPAERTCCQKEDRHCGKERDVPLRSSAEVTADDMGHRVESRPHANPDERNSQPVGAKGHACEQEHHSKPDLERTDILQEMLVVWLKRGKRVEEGTGIDHRPHPWRDEADADDDRDGAGHPGPQGR